MAAKPAVPRLNPITFDVGDCQLPRDDHPPCLWNSTIPFTAGSRSRQYQPLPQLVSVTKPLELGGAWSLFENSKPAYTVGVVYGYASWNTLASTEVAPSLYVRWRPLRSVSWLVTKETELAAGSRPFENDDRDEMSPWNADFSLSP